MQESSIRTVKPISTYNQPDLYSYIYSLELQVNYYGIGIDGLGDNVPVVRDMETYSPSI